MAEEFICILEEGPYPGKNKLPKDQEWPPPEEILPIDGLGRRLKIGKYVKYWQSQGEAKEGELRGAKYKWQEEQDLLPQNELRGYV